MSTGKVILVTGASSGIGQALAQLLASHGFTVFGTSRNPSSYMRPSSYELLPLDVRSDQSAQDCVNIVIEKAGRLDVLINNAGYTLCGALEEVTLEQAKALFDTNFFGMVRMIKLILPIMRKQKNGHIINVSSGMSLARAPFLGIYAASKCAMDGYTEVLWHELHPLNIKVSVLHPGFIKSHIVENAQYGEERIYDYDPWRERGLKAVHGYLHEGDDATFVANCVLVIINSNNPALYYRIGHNVGVLSVLRRLLPYSIFATIIRRYFKLDIITSSGVTR